MRHIKQLGTPFHFKRALDFGCGIGRLTQALAGGRFAEAHGVDVSPEMIHMARKYNHFPDTCMYHASADNALAIFPDGYFDFIYSKITLQHIRPEYSLRYLERFADLLAKNGILYFQLTSEPTELLSPKTAYQKIKSIVPKAVNEFLRDLKYRNRGRIDVYGVPKDDIINLLERNGLTLIQAIADNCAGPNWNSFTYCFIKRINQTRTS